MYLRKKPIHPAVLTVMERKQPVGKPTLQYTQKGKVLLESVHSGRSIIVEKKVDPVLGDLVVPVNEHQMFLLNEHGQYELINENIFTAAVNGLRWLYGALKNKLRRIFVGPNETEKFLEAYEKNPKAAREHLQKRLEEQGKAPEDAKKQVDQFVSSHDKLQAANRGLKVRDVQMARALGGIDQAVKNAGGDPAAARSAVNKILSTAANVFAPPAQVQQQGAQPAAKPAAPAQAKQPAAQQPAAQQKPAKRKTVDNKFEEGDEVTATDPQTNAVHTGKVTIVDDKGNYVVNTGKPSADGKSTVSLPAAQYQWQKVDTTQQGAQPQQQAQPAAQPQQAAAQPAAQPAPEPAQPAAQQPAAQPSSQETQTPAPKPVVTKPAPPAKPQKHVYKTFGDSVEGKGKPVEKSGKGFLEVFESINPEVKRKKK